jgi:tetratricopeptide (TPR) repeat protein/TolB-like protein
MLEGQNISHYELGEKLGEGGMGVVYKAWDRKLNRFVALKFLSGSWANSHEQVIRFQQEAQAISALNHPNIATIYEIDEADGRCFLALEYLPGGTLKTALDQLASAGQQLSVEQGLEYALQLTEAVAHAHAHGVIHRDIKSANALFTEAGAVKLTDFGLAKLARGSNVTQTGSVMGTPVAMSPEQAQGQETDERSDVFSLGVVMFELFSGELPFRGENSLAILHQIVNVTAPPLGRHRSGIPVALERIVAKALERDRAERYQSAANLAADLRALRRELLFGSSAQRSSLETVAIGASPVRRRRGPTHKRTLGVVAACVVLGAAGWVAWPSVRARTVSWFRAQSLPAEKRLAILPFRNFSGDAKDQPFVDGLREIWISKLTRMEHGGSLLVVMSPDEVQVKEVSTAMEAGKRLGATLVITGVVQSGPVPQVFVTLMDPQTSTVLDSKTIDVSDPDLTAGSEILARMLDLGINEGSRRDLQAEKSSNPAATRYYVEGRGYLLRADRLENLIPATNAFRDAVGKDANYALAWAGWAEALWQRYRIEQSPALLDEATDHVNRALGLNSGLAAVHIIKSKIYREQGKYPEAAQELQESLKIEAANARAYQDLGNVYAAQKQYNLAEMTFQNALDMRPGDPAAYVNRGKFYFNRGKLPEAERDLKTAADLIPDSYQAHSNLGAVFGRMGRYAEAAAEFTKSLSIAPNAPGYNGLGTALYRQRDYLSAAQAYSEAVKRADANSQYWGNLADAYRWAPALRDKAPDAYRQAIARLGKQLEIKPNDAVSLSRLATYHVAIRDNRTALSEVERAIQMESSSAQVQFNAALVYEQVHQRKPALGALEKALQVDPEIMRAIAAAPPLDQLRTDPQFARIARPRQ